MPWLQEEADRNTGNPMWRARNCRDSEVRASIRHILDRTLAMGRNEVPSSHRSWSGGKCADAF